MTSHRSKADVIRSLTDGDGRVPACGCRRPGSASCAISQPVVPPMLGGHVDAAMVCGEVRVSYNSCRNRHFRSARREQRGKWLENRCQDLGPVPDFQRRLHPAAELAPLALAQPMAKSAAPCSMPPQLPQDHRRPTWPQASQALRSASSPCCDTWGHPGAPIPISSCVIPGGGLAPDAATWISRTCSRTVASSRSGFSRGLFRGKMLAALQQRFAADRLHFRRRS